MSNASSKQNPQNRRSYFFRRSSKKVGEYSSIPKQEVDSNIQKGFGGPARIILAAFGIFILSQVGAILVVELAVNFIPLSFQTAIDQSAALQFVYILLAEALVIGGVFWLLRRRGIRQSAIGLGRRPLWRDLGWAAVGYAIFFVALVISTIILTLLIPGFDTEQPQDVGFNFLSTSTDQIIAFVALVILPPLGEETLMRGYLYSALRSRWRFLPAMVVTSLLFGVAHLTTGTEGALWAAGMATFILSLVLVYVREITGALYAPMMIHAFNNLVAFFFST
ncbi:CPBP family intramembrane metalloprotease [Candidatus Saccharibacteria bacterium]|nr:CPBP family intramembrane metalloprotease [Candidatus Saccharibacteria bacterium]